MASLILNGTAITVNAPPDTPLLWDLRDHLKLTGTKFGCGASLCGACTVHVDGVATRSCVEQSNFHDFSYAVFALTGKRIRSTPLEDGGVRFAG